MTSIKKNLFQINGLVSTNKTALQNLNDLATAGGAWITYDIVDGKYSVIINRAGTSIASFNDSNILGGINVSGTGINELYNSVTIEYPHKDLKDATDFLELKIPDADRFPNELDKKLNIKTNLLHDPIQAQQIAGRELKQSRVDKVIEFRTDFSYLGLKGGDLIDVTSDQYGFANKVFRIVSVQEDESEEFVISIRAIEYSDEVYDISDLEGGNVRTERSPQTGIQPKAANQELATLDDIDTGSTLLRLLAGNAIAGLINSVLDFDEETGEINQSYEFKDDNVTNLLSNVKPQAPQFELTAAPSVCEGASVTVNLAFVFPEECSSCLVDVDAIRATELAKTDGTYDYEISGIDASDIDVPLNGTIVVSGGTGSLVITAADDADALETMTVSVEDKSVDIDIVPLKEFTYSVSASPQSITEGDSTTVTLTTSNIADGTVLDYEITGAAIDRVDTALTGTVTVNADSADLVVNTTDDSEFQGTTTFTVTFDPTLDDPCGTVGNNSIVILVSDNETEPPPDYTQQYIQVPVVWVGTYDANDNQLKELSPLRSMSLPVPLPGNEANGINVPQTVSVAKGNPSVITIETSVLIDPTVQLGGVAVNVITDFDDIPPNGDITGTRLEFYGFD